MDTSLMPASDMHVYYLYCRLLNRGVATKIYLGEKNENCDLSRNEFFI